MLEVKHLKRVYKVKNGQPVYALDDVSGLVFILGKSGSGKSTLLNVMGGLDKVDDGEIIINGKSSKEFSGSEMDSYRNTYLGFIFQEYNILNDFTVKENIGLALQLQHKKATDEEIDKILAEVDLTGYGKRKPNELSGGQKQRVAIARALVKEPKIIFGDEPTGALDSNTGRQVFETLKKLSKDKLVVIVSHDRDFAEHFGDRVIELKDGKVISDISKMSVEAKQEKPGVSILGNNVIRIEKGHTLNVDDLDIINKALANKQTDTFITADEHVNDVICEAARIDKSGNRQEFISTNYDDIKTGDEKFEVIKSNFSLRNAFKMGSRSLKVKPFRLVMTILLSSVSFTLFGASVTIGLFSSATAMTDTAIADNITTSFLNTSYQQEHFEENYLPEEEKKALEDHGGKVYDTIQANYNFSNNVPNTNDITYLNFQNNAYYSSYLTSGVPASNTFINDAGFTLVAGTLPVETSDVALSVHSFETFQDFGFVDTIDSSYILSATDTTNPITYDKIIGHYISCFDSNYNSQTFRVTGFIDTHFDNDTYGTYRKRTESVNWTDETYQGLFSMQDSLHQCLFMNPTITSVKSMDKEANSSLASLSTMGYESHMPFGYYPSHKNIAFFDENKTSLNEDEAVVHYSNYFQILGVYNEENQRTYTPENAYSDYAKTSIMSCDLTNRNFVYNVFIPEASSYLVSREKFLEFKDTETFKVFFEQREENYGFYNNYGQFRDPSDESNFLYPWENDASYVLTDYDKSILYECTAKYLLNIFNMEVTNARYYSDMVSEVERLKIDFDEQCPMTNRDKLICFSEKTNSIREEFVQEYAESIYERYKDNANYSAIYERMKVDSIPKVTTLNEILFSEQIKEIVSEYNEYYLNEIGSYIQLLDLQDVSLKVTCYGYETKEFNIKIVGFDFDIPSYKQSVLHFNESTTTKFREANNDYDRRDENHVCLLPKDKGQLLSFFEYIEKKNKEFDSYDYGSRPVGIIKFHINDYKLSSVQSLSSVLSILTQVFIYVGLALAVFAMFLFYNFISISINNKKREIGILRAVGAKRLDVFKIFYSESFIIAIINFILASISTLVLSFMLNGLFQENSGVTFNIMSPNILVFIVIMAISLGTSIIAALIPVTRLANKKPIDAIQNR